MKSEAKKEIQTYIRYANGNDLEDECGDYIQMLFFLSQMMLEKDLELDERVIQSTAQKLAKQIGQTLNVYFGSSDKGMYSELGMLSFFAHEIMERTGELKEASELLDRFLLDQACQKTELEMQLSVFKLLLLNLLVHPWDHQASLLTDDSKKSESDLCMCQL